MSDKVIFYFDDLFISICMDVGRTLLGRPSHARTKPLLESLIDPAFHLWNSLSLK